MSWRLSTVCTYSCLINVVPNSVDVAGRGLDPEIFGHVRMPGPGPAYLLSVDCNVEKAFSNAAPNSPRAHERVLAPRVAVH